jgi:DNA-binding transcriptional LysR family regulator
VAWIASPNLDLPNRRLSLADLARWPIISSRLHVPHSVTINELLKNADLPDAQHYTSTSIASIVHMTRDAIGVGVIPLVLVWRELAEGGLRLLDTDLDLPGLDFSVSFPFKPDSHLAVVVAELAITVARDYHAGPDGP